MSTSILQRVKSSSLAGMGRRATVVLVKPPTCLPPGLVPMNSTGVFPANSTGVPDLSPPPPGVPPCWGWGLESDALLQPTVTRADRKRTKTDVRMALLLCKVRTRDPRFLLRG